MSIFGIRPMGVVAQLLGAAAIVVSAVASAYAQGDLPVPSTARVPAPATSVAFNIPAQPLTTALSEFARQSGQQLLFSPEIVSGKVAGPVHGSMLPLEALDQLLDGSGLVRTLTPSGAILINGNDFSGGPNGPKADGSGGSDGAILGGAEVMADAGADGATGAAARVQVSQQGGIEEIIVTGQKREERIQDVPIAISAFSMENLDNQKIEGGFDLLKAVPNVTFSKSNFTGYNFQIRGIGTQAISATTDPGVAVGFNNTTLIVNRLFEQEYLDIERVEVLRGPQGTLFGRNATAGVINVITAKPEMGYYGGEFKVEIGNYGAERFRGHINVPLGGDTLAARLAFAATKRDGYGRNLAFEDPEIQGFIREHDRAPISANIDNRDLWTGRVSLGWQPSDRFRANLIYERFEEDDRRMRSTKQLCHHADGNVTLYDENGAPITVRGLIERAEAAGGAPISKSNVETRYLSQLSQGCLPGSLFDKGNVLSSQPTDHGAYGTPNANSMPYVRGGRGTAFQLVRGLNGPQLDSYPGCIATGTSLVTECITDPMRSVHGQSRSMRDIFSLIDPRYEALSELGELSVEFDLSDGLMVSLQSVYMTNELFSTQDFLRFKTQPFFNDSSNAHIDFFHKRNATPKGVFDDPQLGKSDRLLMQDVSQLDTKQFSQEIRLTSSLDGPINFSVGANYTQFENTADYFVFINALSAFAHTGSPYTAPLYSYATGPGESIYGMWSTVSCGKYYAQSYIDGGMPAGQTEIGRCVLVQDGSIDDVRNDPQGHQFFLSRNPFELKSAGLFGEIYYEFTPAVKLTAGLRFNWDRKTFTPVPSQTLLADWRGRVEGPSLFDLYRPLPPDADMRAICDPRSPTRRTFTLRSLCALAGSAEYGRGYPALPDIVQEWRVPTGRIGIDWKADFGLSWVDESLLYAFYTRGYKAGGANPPVQAPPSGILLEAAQGIAAPRVFAAEYVNAVEVGSKNRLLGGLVTLNGTAFYYDYKDYQVSKIVDRTAVNENVDANIWGLELEAVFAPSADTLLNANIGFLKTHIANNTHSLDLMDRAQGGNHHYVDPAWAMVSCGTTPNHIACIEGERYRNGFDQWVIVRPSITQASSCLVPAVLVYKEYSSRANAGARPSDDELSKYCPGGQLITEPVFPGGFSGYNPFTSAPNGGAGFLADVSGNQLPNAPQFTVSLGAQQTWWLPRSEWSLTARLDYYWQDESYNRIYNTEYDRLRDWSSANVSIWLSNDHWGLTIEGYVKNIFDETPITGAFLNSDDTGLSTNVFTLDPRLIGLSIRKRF